MFVGKHHKSEKTIGGIDMRMHMLPTEIMCPHHRSGEHNEIHKHFPSLLRGHSIRGRYYLKNCGRRFSPQIELCSIRLRHDELAKTMNHKSMLPDSFEDVLKRKYPEFYYEKIDRVYSFWRLWLTCPHCRKLMGRNWRISREVLMVG